jgi:hypothetical protein
MGYLEKGQFASGLGLLVPLFLALEKQARCAWAWKDKPTCMAIFFNI